jgi:hypothetical protein
MWTCSKCGRQFERQGQSHSCNLFPVEKHFEGKPFGEFLFEALKKSLKQKKIGYKIESLECCIHFVKKGTFAAAKIFRDKIRIDFALARKLTGKRFNQVARLSAHRYLYVVDIFNESEIDGELMEWLAEACEKKNEMKKEIF